MLASNLSNFCAASFSEEGSGFFFTKAFMSIANFSSYILGRASKIREAVQSGITPSKPSKLSLMISHDSFPIYLFVIIEANIYGQSAPRIRPSSMYSTIFFPEFSSLT